MIDPQVSSPSALHLKLPNCNIQVKAKSSRNRPIKIKIAPTPDGSVELTLLAVVPHQAPDQGSLVSTSSMLSPTSSFLEVQAAPFDIDIINPILLGQEPGQSTIPQKHFGTERYREQDSTQVEKPCQTSPKKQLPACMQAHPNDPSKIHCMTSVSVRSGPAEHMWISRTSLSHHLKSAMHEKNCEVLALEKLKQDREMADALEMYNRRAEGVWVLPPSLEPWARLPMQMEWDDRPCRPDIQHFENEELDYMTATMRKHVTVEDNMELVARELEGYRDYINQIYISPEDETEEEDVSLPEIIHGMSAIDLAEVTLDSMCARYKNMKSSEDWYPYQTKTMCLLDLLDNLP
ncbi:hypothetical protein K439DRAFT_1619281 [Ramaria rubella]|nr:hypothetical protein K439DRAFT_1619281 [Ramaria rubella]